MLSESSIKYRALLVMPRSLRDQQVIAQLFARVNQRLVGLSISFGQTNTLPFTVVGGPSNCRLQLSWVGDNSTITQTHYDAVGIVTDRRKIALTQMCQLEKTLSSVPMAVISDDWCHRSPPLQLSIEAFIAGVMAGELAKGRTIVYREKKPVPPKETTYSSYFRVR